MNGGDCQKKLRNFIGHIRFYHKVEILVDRRSLFVDMQGHEWFERERKEDYGMLMALFL